MAKHKYIETPEKMWELFQEYKKETKANSIQVQDYVGKDGDMVYRAKERPLTMDGFECFVMEHEGVESKGVEQYFSNRDERYSEYVGICSRIKKEIRKDQIEGGMASIYNASITQRLNGLADKREVTEKGEPRVFNINYK